jgi:16S rRNA (cytosine1402-N4)-methyltransferase
VEGPVPEDKPAEHRRRPRYPGRNPQRFDQRYKELAPQSYPEIHAHIRAQGRTPAGTHVPVLLAEALAALNPSPGEIVVDCTLGYGGHAAAFLERILPGGRLIGLDVDGVELQRTRCRLEADLGSRADRLHDLPPMAGSPAASAPPGGSPGGAVSVHACNFAGIAKVLRAESLAGFDIVFADLGVSSMQVDDPQRGFSYKHDGPLDMRMSSHRRTAAEILESITEEGLAAALRQLGDEPDAEAIARLLVERRARQPLSRTGQVVRLILEAKGLAATHAGEHGRHPAALAFQALRILVNDELGCLAQLLRDAPHCLQPGGRLGIISYHSGEDRLVKHALRAGLRSGAYAAVASGPIRATAQENRANPRSAAAKLRWARAPGA